MSLAPFSFDRTGSVQVSIDGPELLVYSGDGVPMWKEFLQGIGFAVHAAGQRIATFDTDGRMVSFTAQDGTPVVDTNLDVVPVAVTGARDGRAAVVGADAVLLVSRDGETFRIEHVGGTQASFGGDGQTQLAVVGDDGVLTVFDVQTAGVLYSVDVGVPLVDVAFSGMGRWLVLGAGQITQYVVTGGDETTAPSLQLLRAIPVSPNASRLEVADDGVIVAALCGTREIRVLEIWTDRTCGTISLGRDIGDISFGAGGMLGIGLEDGDSNRVNVTVGGSWRSSPGFGRGSSTWGCQVQIDHVTLRSAVIDATSGGKPVAKVVLRADQKKSNTVFYVLGAFFGVCALCGCCSGTAGLMWAFF